MSARIKLGLWLLAGALIVLYNAAFIVPQTHQALVLQLGSYVTTYREPGLKFKIPFVQNVEMYDARLLDFIAEQEDVILGDSKRMKVDAFVRYRISDPLRYKQSVGGDERALRSRLNAIVESSLRQVLGGVPLAAVISDERSTIMQQIRELVHVQARGGSIDAEGTVKEGSATQGFGIDVVDVRIMRADLPPENSERIYSRMQTERDRQAKEFRAQGAEDAQKIRANADRERTILLAEARKKAEILRGEGDGEATRIFAEATNRDPEFYQFYRTLQAYRKTLSKEDTSLIVSPSSEFMRTFEKGSKSQ